MDNNNYLRTSSLHLAATLNCLGYSIIELDRSADPKRVVFCFDKDQRGFEEAVQGFWDGSLRLPPSTLFSSEKNLKARIYNEQI
ncbi:MAG: DUF5659 domain-containing protein [Candidatus Peribacteraceae bacterium]|jgi:hypothetical protein|nr:DUF5659 domain-containing protein [Candidatus Peribacteraceae bacterium]|tara:strand:+ start:1504 stop:1755 length:252 start_codon:yes stop_codon:yes gene_type:complete